MLDWSEIVLRVGAATLIGGAIGLNRDLHHKSAGVRTLGLVSLMSAAITLGTAEIASLGHGTHVVTQVVQGLLTGVGFIGAGVIVHGAKSQKVHGLTTAAAIWSATGLGVLCAYGLWPLIVVSAGLVLALLTVGGHVEKWLHGALAGDKADMPDKPPPSG